MFNRLRRGLRRGGYDIEEEEEEMRVLEEKQPLLPEIEVEPQRELRFYEHHYGSDPENLQSYGGEGRTFSISQPEYDPNVPPTIWSDARTQFRSTSAWGLPDIAEYPDRQRNTFGLRNYYNPKKRDASLQTPDSSLRGFGFGEYEFTKTFEEDIEMFSQVGVFINRNATLGSGASGTVVYGGHYSGISEVWNNKRFAVKVAFYKYPNDPRCDIEKEKDIMNRVDHKYLLNIQNVINMGDVRPLSFSRMVRDPRGGSQHVDETTMSSDRVYIFMEFSDLGPLDSYFDKNPNFNSNELRALTYQVLEGLNYMHKHGLCHSDLHLGNVLLFSNHDHINLSDLNIGQSIIGKFEVSFTAKIADFGLSDSGTHFDQELRSLGLRIFLMLLAKEGVRPSRIDFDEGEDEIAYREMTAKMRSSPDIPTLYQTPELKNWFKIVSHPPGRRSH